MSAESYLSHSNGSRVSPSARPQQLPIEIERYLAQLPMTFRLGTRALVLAILGFLFSMAILAGEMAIAPLLIATIRSTAARDKAFFFLVLIHPGWIVWLVPFFAVPMFANSLARFADVMQGGKLLTIDGEGLHGQRFDDGLIPWEDIETYDVFFAGRSGRLTNIRPDGSKGPIGATLYLRRSPPGPVRRWRLFLRALATLKPPNPCVLRLDLPELTMDGSRRDICHLIIALAEHHGAKARRRWYEPQA